MEKSKIFFPAHTPDMFKVNHLKYVGEIWIHLIKRVVICIKYKTAN